MVINHNLMAINSHRVMGINNLSQSKSLEKLSTGLKINRAGDDAAGLAISEKMRGQIRGLTQASRNAQDGISFIQTAEGGCGNSHNILQRMRELAVLAANDTNTDSDREKIQLEIDQSKQQLNMIANTTEFNTIKMLNETAAGETPFTNISQSQLDTLSNSLTALLDDSLDTISSRFDGLAHSGTPNLDIEYYEDASPSAAGAMMGTSDGINLTLRVNVAQVFDGSGNLISTDSLDRLIAHEVMHGLEFTEMGIVSGGLTDEETWFAEGLSMSIQGGNDFLASAGGATLVGGAFGNTTQAYANAYVLLQVLHNTTDGGIDAVIDRLVAGDSLDTAIATTTQSNTNDAVAGWGLDNCGDFSSWNDLVSYYNSQVTNGNMATSIANEPEFNNTNGTGTLPNATDATDDSAITAANTVSNDASTATADSQYGTISFLNSTFNGSGSSITLQIGANTGQTIDIKRHDLRTSALGIESASVSTRAEASAAISLFQAAIEKVSSIRAYYGASQNRLEKTIANLDNTAENLQTSESRIRDLDMSEEFMNFTKSNILQQAAQAMLAQANQQPQGVLSLLR